MNGQSTECKLSMRLNLLTSYTHDNSHGWDSEYIRLFKNLRKSKYWKNNLKIC